MIKFYVLIQKWEDKTEVLQSSLSTLNSGENISKPVKFLAFTIWKFIMAFLFRPCIEILHISLTKTESWIQLSFNEFETSFYIRTPYWSIMLYLFAVFLVHMITMCLNPLTTKISPVILLTVCHTFHLMLVWKIWNWINQ